MYVLVFGVDQQRYALPAASVREIVRAVAITPLPDAPRSVEGVIDFRGTVVPVLDVRLRFGLAAHPVVPTELLIIADASDRLVALRCHRDAAVRLLLPAEIESGDQDFSRSPFVAGLARLPDGLVVIHDLAAFMSEAEAASLERALPAHQDMVLR